MQYQHMLEAGQVIECNFGDLAERYHNWKVDYATKEEDMKHHWDLAMSRRRDVFLVDVKSRKKLARRGFAQQDGWVWIELHGVRKGDKGWLYGWADLIAFETASCFVLVSRKHLAEIAEELVPEDAEQVEKSFQAKYKRYRRKNRPHEWTTLIKMADVLSVAVAVWPKNAPTAGKRTPRPQ